MYEVRMLPMVGLARDYGICIWIACKIISLIFNRHAKEWFSKLPHASIEIFE